MKTLGQWTGWIGFALDLACWIPQTWQTVCRKAGRLSRNFMVLTALGSAALALHAHAIGDLPFTLLKPTPR